MIGNCASHFLLSQMPVMRVGRRHEKVDVFWYSILLLRHTIQGGTVWGYPIFSSWHFCHKYCRSILWPECRRDPDVLNKIGAWHFERLKPCHGGSIKVKLMVLACIKFKLGLSSPDRAESGSVIWRRKLSLRLGANGLVTHTYHNLLNAAFWLASKCKRAFTSGKLGLLKITTMALNNNRIEKAKTKKQRRSFNGLLCTTFFAVFFLWEEQHTFFIFIFPMLHSQSWRVWLVIIFGCSFMGCSFLYHHHFPLK